MLFGAPTITAWRVEFNMASCCASSNSSDESGAESSDVFSEADIASEDESVGSEDSDRSSDEEISALWTRVYPPEPDDRVEDNFSVRNPGVQNMPARDSSPAKYFYLFLTAQILGKILSETRKYAGQFFRGAGDTLSPQSRARRWNRLDFGINHLKKFIGLSLLMGIVRIKDVTSYWSERFACLSTPYFRNIMSRNVFQLVSKFLHCHDNQSEDARRNSERYDPLHKFRLLLNGLNDACKRYFIPDRLISIDESLIGMKNRTELMQYIPNKHHHKWGVKLYSLTDSVTGFPLHTMVYCGKKRSQPSSEFGHSYDVVKELMTEAGLLNKGYHLFVDNFYTSPTLAQYLHSKKTLLTGTLRSNRKGVPQMLKAAKPKEQECMYFRKGPILALSWREKKSQKNPCLMLTTGIPAGMVDHRRRDGTVKQLPHPVSMYNKHMGGVDLLDQMVDHVAAERAFHKFWKKCFFALLDRMAFCAYVLYVKNTSATRKLARIPFMCTLIEELCGQELDLGPHRPLVPQGHQIEKLPNRKEKDCVVCSNRAVVGGRRRSKTQCVGCGVGVHLECFDLLDHNTKKRKQI